MDYRELSDEELEAAAQGIALERERRANLLSLPGQIANLTERYLADGGDPAELEKDKPHALY